MRLVKLLLIFYLKLWLERVAHIAGGLPLTGDRESLIYLAHLCMRAGSGFVCLLRLSIRSPNPESVLSQLLLAPYTRRLGEVPFADWRERTSLSSRLRRWRVWRRFLRFLVLVPGKRRHLAPLAD